MKIDGSVALAAGANRGLGQVYARELVRRGAGQVYGAARDAAAVTEAGVTPVALDITDPPRVAQVAGGCADVRLLVNNAGVMQASTFVDAPGVDAARLVVGGHAGFIDTEIAALIDAPKISPEIGRAAGFRRGRRGRRARSSSAGSHRPSRRKTIDPYQKSRP
jgi:NADP-dependent 3-hydroxy acid dehydrogenase YdfG